ncbi:MAG TPA: hypothetical protein VEK05_03640, partial [Burkholderiales bacterium]|nr:hypothetical protein [Burkholderiales bacterium]
MLGGQIETGPPALPSWCGVTPVSRPIPQRVSASAQLRRAMNKTTVFSKTGKGLLEIKNKSNRLSKDQF